MPLPVDETQRQILPTRQASPRAARPASAAALNSPTHNYRLPLAELKPFVSRFQIATDVTQAPARLQALSSVPAQTCPAGRRFGRLLRCQQPCLGKLGATLPDA